MGRFLEMLHTWNTQEFVCFTWKAVIDSFPTYYSKCCCPDALQDCFSNLVFGFWLPV